MKEVEVMSIEKNRKTFLIIGIFILIVLFGTGLFCFLRFAKEQKNIKLKNDTIELGSKLNKDIRHYVDGNSKNCKINLKNVDVNKVGKYKYTVKCNKLDFKATIEVKDTQAPIMKLKTLNLKPSQKYEAKDFVISSQDLSEYDILLKDQENSKATSGLYLISIIAKDIYDNETEKQGILVVSEVLSEKYLTASKELKTDYDATLSFIDKIGINYVNFYNNAIRMYEYTFNKKEDYTKALEEYQKNNTIENNSGQIISNDKEMNIKLVKMVEREELNDLNGNFPYTYNEISSLYNKLGYTTKLEK